MSAELPISSVLPEIFSALTEYTRVILQAPPGAGKSTYLPLQLLKHPDFAEKRIVMLEPRRLAARSIAEYLAQKLDQTVGETVGIRMKQMTKVSSSTRLEIVTEGVLTRIIQNDPELTGIDILIFDEFHERSLAADLALALSLDVQASLRDDLRLLIMSATLDQAQLAEKLDACVVSSEGRSYPVETHYIPLKLQRHQQAQFQRTYAEWQRFWAHLHQVIVDVVENYAGSILVFLPGQGEILRVQQALSAQQLADTFGQVRVVPLYGRLSKGQQWQAIAPAANGERKIVLTTNIAETSLTIEGIQLVIDAGYCRRAVFLPKVGVTQLQTVAISKASAVQRAGRAGRLGPGHCFRLEEEARFQRREAFEPAEIEISDLSALCLDVLLWGSQLDDMPWIQAPPKSAIKTALQHLCLFGVVNEQHELTYVGRKIGQLGLPLRAGCMIIHALQAIDSGKLPSLLVAQLPTLAAWIDENPIKPRETDSAALLPILIEFQRSLSQRSSPQLQQAVRWWRNKIKEASKALQMQSLLDTSPPTTIQMTADCLALMAFAFPERIGFRRASQPNGRFLLSHGSTATITATQWAESAEEQQCLAQGKRLLIAAQMFVRDLSEVTLATSIDSDELRALMPWLFTEQTFIGWNAEGNTLVAEHRECLGRAVLATKPLAHALTHEQQQQALAELLRKKGLSLLNWTAGAEQLKRRLALAHEYYPSADFPAVDDKSLLQHAQSWCLPMVVVGERQLPSVKHLKAVNVEQALLTLLDYSKQQRLNEYFPESFKAASGRRFPIIYRDNAKPKLSVQLQELFGVEGVISIAQGKIPVVAELLSPARRPIQITEDLGRFWQTSYPEVAKEMRGKYPKHRWPEDPVNELPGRSTKGKTRS